LKQLEVSSDTLPMDKGFIADTKEKKIVCPCLAIIVKPRTKQIYGNEMYSKTTLKLHYVNLKDSQILGPDYILLLDH
jgi:hypothetical protein